MKKYLPLILVCSLGLSGCPLEEVAEDNQAPAAEAGGPLAGVDFDGTQFVTPTPSPTPTPTPSPTATPEATPEILLNPLSLAIPFNTSTTLSVIASGNNREFQWFEGPKDINTTPVGNDSPLFATGNLTSTKLYWVRVTNGGGGVSSEAAQVTVLDQPPGITTQPQDDEILAGETATFSVVASGQNLNYQWYFGVPPDITVPLVGEVGPAFTTGPLTEIEPYWVRVSNSGGIVNSELALAIVVEVPVINNQPLNQTVLEGAGVTLTVGVDSFVVADYQWYRGLTGDTTDPVGGNEAFFETGPLTTTTPFWVKATNAAGSVSSNTATVTVVSE